MAAKKVKKSTKKTVKVTVPTINKENIQNIQDSLVKMKDNAMDVNTQVVEMATEVVKDLRKNTDGLKDVANKTVNLAMDKVNDTVEVVTEKVTYEKIKKGAKNVNQYTLKTADEFVDGALANGEKWQGVANKAMKGGLKLAEKQQEMMFDTLEVVKGQLIKTTSRLKKVIFSKN